MRPKGVMNVAKKKIHEFNHRIHFFKISPQIFDK